MATFSFTGNRVAASSSANDNGTGVDLELDTSRDLDGSGNPYYSSSSVVQITIPDEDISALGELQAAGSDGEVTVSSIKVDGVELLGGTDKIKTGDGSDTFEGDSFIFVEGIKLFFLTPAYGQTFEDASVSGGKLILTIGPRVNDIDLNGDGDTSDPGETGNGIFNVNPVAVCFARGVRIITADGPKRVERLKCGDKVQTQDSGVKSIRWIGTCVFDKADLETNPKLRPVKIVAGALGNGLPLRDMLVSPQHRMLVKSKISEKMFGSVATLIPAIKLIKLPGIFVDETVESVEYFHLLFDQHEIIFAEGAPTESLYTGPEALKSLSAEAREEIFMIFPELADPDYTPKPALYIPPGKLQKQLVARHLKNSRPLLNSDS